MEDAMTKSQIRERLLFARLEDLPQRRQRAELGDLYVGLLVIVLPSVAVVAAIVMAGGRL